MSKRHQVAKQGETWVLRKRNGAVVTLTLGTNPQHFVVWYFPGTMEEYRQQDLVGLKRRVT